MPVSGGAGGYVYDRMTRRKGVSDVPPVNTSDTDQQSDGPILRIRAAGRWEQNAEDPYVQLENHLRTQLAGVVLEEDESEEDLVRQVKAMLRLWIEQVMPAIALEPAAIELRMEGYIGPVRVQGTADVITPDRMIVDLKTTGKKPAGVKDSHMQLATTPCSLTRPPQVLIHR